VKGQKVSLADMFPNLLRDGSAVDLTHAFVGYELECSACGVYDYARTLTIVEQREREHVAMHARPAEPNRSSR